MLVLTAWLAALDTGIAHGEAGASVVVEPGRYGPYFHLRLGLTAADIDFAASDRRTRSGGQFELRLHRERFPVPAPHCRGTVILRMPWTPPDTPDAAAKMPPRKHYWLGSSRYPRRLGTS